MRRWLAAGVAIVALAAGAWLLLRDGEDAEAANPHAGVRQLDPAERARVLRAAEAASTERSPAALAAEGRRLFRDAGLAKDGESCQSCHTEGGGANAELGAILHPQEQGDFRGPRDVPSLWGVAETPPYGWGGTEPSLETFAAGTIKSHFRGGDTQSPERTAEQVAALVAYLKTLTPPVSAFDQGTLSEAARRGEELFQGKGGCIDCHSGPLLTDNAVHDTLTPLVSQSDTDPGAARSGPLKGAFNTPHLRDVRNTAPYMHNGSLRTLADVVDFYDRRSSISPLRLTESQRTDLVAYLESL